MRAVRAADVPAPDGLLLSPVTQDGRELIEPLRAQLASLGRQRPECVEHPPFAEPAVDDPEPVKDLECARLDSGRPGLSVGRRIALDETERDAQRGQQAAEHESRRAGTHDEHVGIGASRAPWYTGAAPLSETGVNAYPVGDVQRERLLAGSVAWPQAAVDVRLTYRGRVITEADGAFIRALIAGHPGASRRQLSGTFSRR